MSKIYGDIFTEIVKINPTIEELNFSEYPSNIMVQNSNDFSLSEKNQLNKAMNIRDHIGFSFWESMMATYINNADPNYYFLDHALSHNVILSLFNFKINQINAISDFLEQNADKNIALLSTVKTTEGTKKHIPMIDFHINVSGYNQNIIEKILINLDLTSGFLINSGKSYHFISTTIIDFDELIRLLASMILFCPIIDRNWIVHQILECNCALRVTKGNKVEPILIRRIN